MPRKLNISLGSSRWATSWIPTQMEWPEFCSRLKTPIRGTETLGEFLKMSKKDQDDRKDVGGFVGGTIDGQRRKVDNVSSRDLLTLDMDNIPNGGTQQILDAVRLLGCAAVVYSTRKHRPIAPRLRIVIPTDISMSIDEYEPICRRVAKMLGINYCDPTTFELNRLMFWPSVSSDGEYVYEVFEGPFLSAKSVLNMYGDWHDVEQWPTVEGEKAAQQRRLAKQQDPTTKEGFVGTFCRAYTIREAMEKFIPGMYVQAQNENRYTYTGGSTSGGAIIYEGDKWLYSHHATDPCCGQLVNAFDMVRLHLYGDKDDDVKPGTPANRMPSFNLMMDMVRQDPEVLKLMVKEDQERTAEAFSEVDTDPQETGEETDNYDWISMLKTTKSGFAKTINNLKIILTHDVKLKDKIVTDEFSGCGLVTGRMPWDPEDRKVERRRWSDADDAGALWYMEDTYGIPSKDKLISALAVVGWQHRINEVSDYLDSLKWDDKPRMGTVFIDYLGAVDNIYTRTVARNSLIAAVARAIMGGIKYDFMPILAGPQGLGKSTFLATLGRQWFSDSLTTFEGKEAAEMLQGTWINEIGELNAMSKYEVAAVKQFLSKQSDIYRAAYGRRTESHPRRCVFFGTSNDAEFLRDYTGNRRFWPVDVGINEPKLSVFDDLPGQVDQIWAEAVWNFRVYGCDDLYLTGEALRLAEEAQEEHREASGWEGLIQDFLEKKVLPDWDRKSISGRTMFRQNPEPEKTVLSELVSLDKVCIQEIWVECLGGDQRYLKPQDRTKIGNIMARMPGWKRIKSTARFGPYGTQKGFRRV